MYSSSDINKIKNSDSRKNFDLVLQSYYSKNYKACILLLYNLVVNDLYSKLVLMNDNNYVNCKSELEFIENTLKEGNESKYSIVEEKTFEIYSAKKILNHSTIDLLIYFKKVRNKCAHPIFFKESDYTPTQEEVYLFLNKIYNDILVVDAFFKDPYEVMKNDIESYQFPDLDGMIMGISTIKKDTERVKKYFENKYYKYMTENNYIKLFKNLMDLSIRKNNDEIIKNQYKHFLLLNSLLDFLSYKGKVSILNQQFDWHKLEEENIRDDMDKKLEEKECFSLTYLLNVLKHNPSFVEELKDANENLYNYLKSKIYSNSYLFVDYWMIFDSDINEAARKIPSTLYSYSYRQIIEATKLLIDLDITIDLTKKLLEKTPTFDGYDTADRNIELFIKILNEAEPKIKQERLNEHFEIMNNNRQIYDKSRNSRDYQFSQIIKLGYDLSEYDNLKVEEGDK